METGVWNAKGRATQKLEKEREGKDVGVTCEKRED